MKTNHMTCTKGHVTLYVCMTEDLTEKKVIIHVIFESDHA